MPGYADIYGLTKHRDAETINRFLDEYLDRAAIEDRSDEELMLVPLGRIHDSRRYLSEERHQYELVHNPAYREQYFEYEWEPALTLSHTIERGLDYPRRSFTVHLQTNRNDIAYATLSFTVDDQLILGLSVSEEVPEVVKVAKQLLSRIMRQFQCYLGVVGWEMVPPISESAFRNLASQRPEDFREITEYR